MKLQKLIVFLFIISVLHSVTYIDSCQQLTLSGETYILTSDIHTYLNDSGNNKCIYIKNVGITFDGAGHTITSNGSGFLVYSNVDNTEIKNIILKNASHGAYVINADNSKVHNLSIFDIKYGIDLYNAEGEVYNNTLHSNEGYGIKIYNKEGTKVYNNKLYGSHWGVYLTTSSYGEVYNNELNSSDGIGIYLYSSPHPKIYNNTLMNITSSAIYFNAGSNYGEVYNNTIFGMNTSSSSSIGIKIAGASINSKVFENNITSPYLGILFYGKGHTIKDNLVTHTRISMRPYAVGNSVIKSNQLENSVTAIYVYDKGNNISIYENEMDNVDTAIRLDGSYRGQTNTRIFDNLIGEVNNSFYLVSQNESSSSNISIYNNNISSNNYNALSLNAGAEGIVFKNNLFDRVKTGVTIPSYSTEYSYKNILIMNNTFKGIGESFGVYIHYPTSNITLKDNYIANFDHGIQVENLTNSFILHNYVIGSDVYGVEIYNQTKNLNVSYNFVCDSEYTDILNYSTHNITGDENAFETSKYFYDEGQDLTHPNTYNCFDYFKPTIENETILDTNEINLNSTYAHKDWENLSLNLYTPEGLYSQVTNHTYTLFHSFTIEEGEYFANATMETTNGLLKSLENLHYLYDKTNPGIINTSVRYVNDSINPYFEVVCQAEDNETYLSNITIIFDNVASEVTGNLGKQYNYTAQFYKTANNSFQYNYTCIVFDSVNNTYSQDYEYIYYEHTPSNVADWGNYSFSNVNVSILLPKTNSVIPYNLYSLRFRVSHIFEGNYTLRCVAYVIYDFDETHQVKLIEKTYEMTSKNQEFLLNIPSYFAFIDPAGNYHKDKPTQQEIRLFCGLVENQFAGQTSSFYYIQDISIMSQVLLLIIFLITIFNVFYIFYSDYSLITTIIANSLILLEFLSLSFDGIVGSWLVSDLIIVMFILNTFSFDLALYRIATETRSDLKEEL